MADDYCIVGWPAIVGAIVVLLAAPADQRWEAAVRYVGAVAERGGQPLEQWIPLAAR